MLRAATTGMIDFNRFDPWDSWWWKKTRWVLKELESQQTADVAKVSHRHWVTMASHGGLNPESFETAKVSAGESFNRYLQTIYPWLAEMIGAETARTSTERLLQAYREEFGQPGDPQYQIMLQNMRAVFEKGPMTLEEREQYKAKVIARKKAAQEAQLQTTE